jgi:putative flavoprotein involved in K+ transport
VDAIEIDATGDTFLVTTTRGVWHTRNVVVATGYSDQPLVPAIAARLDGGVHQIVPSEYRNPAALPGGGVLVVGASATGIQLADEIQASGRRVVISTGQHLRVPRRYRGRDIMWWLDRAGILDATEESVFDVEASRQAPSFQLVGRDDHATLDLEHLRRAGVVVAGRLMAIAGHRLHFADDLVKTTAAADVKLAGLLSRLDTTRLDAVAGVRQRTGRTRPEGRRDRGRGVGDGLPPFVFVAEDPAARCAGGADPSRRRHTLCGHVRDRAAVPADA